MTSKLRKIDFCFSKHGNVMQCFQNEVHVDVEQHLFCIYNEIMRRESINSYKFYSNKCDVNFDDDKIKHHFKLAYEVLRHIPRYSTKLKKHQTIYDAMTQKF